MSDEKVVESPEQERQSAEAAFAAADSPAKAAEPEVKTSEAEPAKETAKEVAPDPWEGVPAVVKQSHEATAQQLAQVSKQLEKFGAFSKEFNDHKANYGNIAASLRRIEAGNAAAKTAAVAPTQEQIAAAAVSPEKWKQLHEMFEAWSDEFNGADMIDARISEKVAAQAAELTKRIPQIDVDGLRREVGSGVDAAIAKSNPEVIRLAREFARVDAKYESWESDVATPAFATWMSKQPPDVKALAESNFARDAMKMLGLYYDHQKAEAARLKNQKRLESAIPAKGTAVQHQSTLSEREAAEKAFASA